MPTFIDMSALTKRSTLTGNEEFQVSATEKVTATQIANKVQLNRVSMSGFEAISINGVEKVKDTNSLIGAMKILYSLSGNGRAKVIGNSENCFGLVSINTEGTLAFGILFDIRSSTPPSIFIRDGFGLTGGASLKNLTDGQWIAEMKKGKKIPMESDIRVVEITDFAIPSVNITKDGQSFLFYANDASNIPNSNHGATSFVGVAIASPIFITGDQRLLYYMMIDTAKAMFYTGYANLEDDTVTWSDTPVTRLGQAVQVIAFTEGALSALLYSYKPGDFIPFYTGNVTASTANQFPESGIFNGFISMGSNEGDYFQIFAFKSGSTKAYLGACIGSTTQWTQIGGSSSSSGGLELVNTTYPIIVGDGSEIALPGVTTGDHLMINLQVVKTGSVIEIWPTGSFCLHCPVPTSVGGPYKLLDIYQYEKGVEAAINIEYVTKSTDAVVVVFDDYNNIDADFATAIHSIYKLPK